MGYVLRLERSVLARLCINYYYYQLSIIYQKYLSIYRSVPFKWWSCNRRERSTRNGRQIQTMMFAGGSRQLSTSSTQNHGWSNTEINICAGRRAKFNSSLHPLHQTCIIFAKIHRVRFLFGLSSAILNNLAKRHLYRLARFSVQLKILNWKSWTENLQGRTFCRLSAKLTVLQIEK